MFIKRIDYCIVVEPTAKTGDIFSQIEKNHPNMNVTGFSVFDEMDYNKKQPKTGKKEMSISLEGNDVSTQQSNS